MKVDVQLSQSVIGAAKRAQELEALGVDGVFTLTGVDDERRRRLPAQRDAPRQRCVRPAVAFTGRVPPRPRQSGQGPRGEALRRALGQARRPHARVDGQNPGLFSKNPVDQFHDNCWVAPFVEDSVPELATHIPVERILFGSDWPHAEGMAHSRDFFKNVEEFSIDDRRKIMVENARALTLHSRGHEPLGSPNACCRAERRP